MENKNKSPPQNTQPTKTSNQLISTSKSISRNTPEEKGSYFFLWKELKTLKSTSLPLHDY